jgi:hypothetical protein
MSVATQSARKAGGWLTITSKLGPVTRQHTVSFTDRGRGHSYRWLVGSYLSVLHTHPRAGLLVRFKTRRLTVEFLSRRPR